MDYDGGAGIGAGLIILYLIIAVFYIIVMWKVFVKAGKPGWGCLIPIYNIILMLEIAARPGWWFILMLIPVVNLVIWIIVTLDIAKAFGKDSGFGIGLILLGFIFYPILAFGSAQYVGIKR
ncbi:MAG: signal peptidase I [Candidatus Cloacimonetes bacterium]|nr:signal peptidase I [Candidatus Cloacimonadota bacterium]